MKEAIGTLQAILVAFKLGGIGLVGGWSWFQVLIPLWILILISILYVVTTPIKDLKNL